MNKSIENPIITAGVDITDTDVSIAYRANWNDFKEFVEWEISPDGEIITDRPEYIPMIKEFTENEVFLSADTLRPFIEKYGGKWLTDEDSPD